MPRPLEGERILRGPPVLTITVRTARPSVVGRANDLASALRMTSRTSVTSELESDVADVRLVYEASTALRAGARRPLGVVPGLPAYLAMNLSVASRASSSGRWVCGDFMR